MIPPPRHPAIAAANLTRKAGWRVSALRKPFLRWRLRAYRLAEDFATYRQGWRVERDIERVVYSDDPVILGPWLSEVGYEILYWIPFVRWLKAAYRLPADRLIVVSRGGVRAWYRDITPRYVEIFDQIDPRTFAMRNLDRSAADGTVKQYASSLLDEEIVGVVKRSLGLKTAAVLHPSLMYRLFKSFWSGHRPEGFIDSHTRYARVEAEEAADLSGLPDDYVAVKFYSATALPDTPEIRHVLRAIIAGLAEQTYVVLLDTGLTLDGHEDYLFKDASRIVSARDLMTAANNLGVQTQIISRAKAFVGTCGSVAWLAPLAGVDTTAIFTDAKFLHAHLHVARRLYHRLEAGRFAPLDIGALGLLGLTLASRAERRGEVVS